MGINKGDGSPGSDLWEEHSATTLVRTQATSSSLELTEIYIIQTSHSYKQKVRQDSTYPRLLSMLLVVLLLKNVINWEITSYRKTLLVGLVGLNTQKV